MTQVARSRVSLSFFGEDLDPAELTAALGGQPTKAYRMGDDPNVPGRRSSWILDADTQIPEDVEGQISDLLGRLTDDVAVWEDLTQRYSARLFCGLFMGGANEGFKIGPALLAEVGRRGLELSFDIYDASDD